MLSQKKKNTNSRLILILSYLNPLCTLTEMSLVLLSDCMCWKSVVLSIPSLVVLHSVRSTAWKRSAHIKKKPKTKPKHSNTHPTFRKAWLIIFLVYSLLVSIKTFPTDWLWPCGAENREWWEMGGGGSVMMSPSSMPSKSPRGSRDSTTIAFLKCSKCVI